MVISAAVRPGEPTSVAAELPYMRQKLHAKLDLWKSLNAPKSVLNWIEFGYMGTFLIECPRIRKQNQKSCYEPIEQFEFVDSSISQLLDRGVIGV